MTKFLDLTGLGTFWTKIKNTFSTKQDTEDLIQDAKDSLVTNFTSELSKKANLASPTFTGTPKAPTAAAGTNTTQIATTAWVNTAIAGKMAEADAMIFKGTIGTSGTVTALPNTHNAGWTYKVITAATYAGKVCEEGDLIICIKDGTAASNDDWTVVQTNIDGAVTGPTKVTANHIATFNGPSGKIIKDSGYTIATSVPANAVFTDTTYESKAAASGGTDLSLVTTGEKATWNAKTTNTGTVTSVAVKMNNSVKGTVTTSGTIDLGTVITAHQDISGKADKATNLTGATKCKITYNSQGIVTGGANLAATDIPSLTLSKISDLTAITTDEINAL